MSIKEEREAARSERRIERRQAQIAACATAAERLMCAYDWFRAAVTSDRTTDAAARELARLAEQADSRTAARGRAHGSV